MKSARSGELSLTARAGNAIINFLVGFYSRTARIYPHWLHRFLSWFFAVGCFLFAHNYRRQTVANFAQVFPERHPTQHLLLTYRSVRNFARYIADLFYLSARPESGPRSMMGRLENGERIREALGRGHGVILTTAHLGNWEIGGFLISNRDLPINIVYLKDRFSRIELLRSKLRRMTGVKEIPLGDSALGALAVLKALQRNEIVGIQVDRDVTAESAPIDFCGGKMSMPAGPALLALISGAVILPSFVLFTPDGKYRALIEEPIYPKNTGVRLADVKATLTDVAAVIERYVKSNPDQWYCFYKVFIDDP